MTPPNFIPVTEGEDRAWTNYRGAKINVHEVAKEIDSYIQKLPEFSQWAQLRAFINGQQLKFAPAKFWIVAIDPITVILTPFDVPKPDSKSISYLNGGIDGRALNSLVLANQYRFGTEIESSESIQWFIVGYPPRLTTNQFVDHQLILTKGSLHLTLTKNANGQVTVTRK